MEYGHFNEAANKVLPLELIIKQNEKNPWLTRLVCPISWLLSTTHDDILLLAQNTWTDTLWHCASSKDHKLVTLAGHQKLGDKHLLLDPVRDGSYISNNNLHSLGSAAKTNRFPHCHRSYTLLPKAPAWISQSARASLRNPIFLRSHMIGSRYHVAVFNMVTPVASSRCELGKDLQEEICRN